MGKLIDMTGKEIAGFLCLKELGSGKVYVRCEKCGREFEAWKRDWKKGTVTCENQDCEKHGIVFTDMVGKEVNEFLCLKELGHSKVYVKCEKCGKEFEAWKDSWKNGTVACRNSNCERTRFLNMTDKEINGFLCLKELGHDKIYVKCMKCNNVFETHKRDWKGNKIACKNPSCEKYSRLRIDMTDKEENGFLCLKELGRSKVSVKCVKCGREFEARKDSWKKSKVTCPNCGIQRIRFRLIEGHTICNVVVIKFAYMGRDSTPYYFCKDARTDRKIEFPLSYTELFTYGHQ